MSKCMYVLINMEPVNLLPAKLKRTVCGIFLKTFLASISLRKLLKCLFYLRKSILTSNDRRKQQFSQFP